MKWTDKEKEFLVDNYQLMSYEDLSKVMERSVSAIRTKVSMMNLPRKDKLDLTNRTFERLTVVRETNKRSNGRVVWECLCECGNKTEVHSSNLMNGKTQSCGCLAIERSSEALTKNIEGKRFGKLRAIKLTDVKRKQRRVWVCECDCGNICEKVSTDLISGDTTSCGCYHLEIMTGVKNWNYNPLLTEEDRLNNGRYTLTGGKVANWRKSVYERDNYTCMVCTARNGNGESITLNAHHINGWHWFESGRFDVDNGVTLCVSCHSDFHKKYGNKFNNKEQFEEFKLSNRKEV